MPENLFDQPVGAQEREFAGYGRSLSALLRFGGRRVSEEQQPQVAIAKASEGELAAADGLQQLGIGRGIGVEGTMPAALVPDRPAEAADQLTQGGGVIDGGQCLQVGVVGGLRDLGAAPTAAPRLVAANGCAVPLW